ncbi:MAG: hypothetical protein BMS9Abin02_0700 [Anaerolineae bacterium]|nr:MAG: hypothetical protein BMS9Abin02_0700 [Anaerolineae bacterium]
MEIDFSSVIKAGGVAAAAAVSSLPWVQAL